MLLPPDAVAENRLDAASVRSGGCSSLAAVTTGGADASWGAAVTVKVVNAPKPAALAAATSSVSATGALSDPATKISSASCAADSVVIWPLGSTTPLSTQKPLFGPLVSSCTSYETIGSPTDVLALNSWDGVKFSLAVALTLDAVTTGDSSTWSSRAPRSTVP